MRQSLLNTAQNKASLRGIAKELRLELINSGQIDKISKQIVQNILNSDIFKRVKNVMLFYPLKGEINLLKLLECGDKNFYFPRCSGDELLVCPHCNDYKKNKYSIPEPLSEPLNTLDVLDIILTPALCVDKNLYRLGYGAGYYDRFFKNEKIRALKIIPISENFLCEKIPADEYDIPCDMAVFENRIMIRE